MAASSRREYVAGCRSANVAGSQAPVSKPYVVITQGFLGHGQVADLQLPTQFTSIICPHVQHMSSKSVAKRPRRISGIFTWLALTPGRSSGDTERAKRSRTM